MLTFVLRRLGVMLMTALVLTFVVFTLTNLPPNLEKLAKSEGSVRMSDDAVASWLVKNGHTGPMVLRYGQWLGVMPGWVVDTDGVITGRCIGKGQAPEEAPTRCGVLQGNWGASTVFKQPVQDVLARSLGHTGWLMLLVMLVMVPTSLVMGVLSGMREGSRLDRTLSTIAIATTATPEYVSGVILVALFASATAGISPWLAANGWIEGKTLFQGTATSAMDDITFWNFALPVLTIALYGIGYIARMTRASMTEVMTQQYIRTARLKGASFRHVVLKHALRNALIAPFTVIMLQFPWLLNGVVIVETLFNYKGFGWTLVQAAGNNDIDLLLGCSVVAVFVVLVTQLISDIGYVFLNPASVWREVIMDTLGWGMILLKMAARFAPVWIALALTFALSLRYRRRLGLYGKLFDSPIGMTGFALVMFWVFTAFFANQIITFDPLVQMSKLKNALPGTPVPGDGYGWMLLGGDNLARDVFSRMVMGARDVLKIAPAATVFAFMVGITLGLPAGYFSGRLDTFLSFLANLVLAFPVILLFYLLVTPEMVATGIPMWMAAVLFIFPVIFLCTLFNSRFFTAPAKRNLYVGATLIIGLWAYAGLAFNADPTGIWAMDPNLLNVFVSVVFVNSPTVFRIVRGLTMDLKARDYVSAAQTRGEKSSYIMLWEILPNARGPLIVDFCLRIGYTTILLGTLGFFGLGVTPESPDWGSTINAGRKLLSVFPHPAVAPALALMSLVLGLNLLADGLREESLKD